MARSPERSLVGILLTGWMKCAEEAVHTISAAQIKAYLDEAWHTMFPTPVPVRLQEYMARWLIA